MNYRKAGDTKKFPEPYLEGNRGFYNRWKRSHLDIILKQDLSEKTYPGGTEIRSAHNWLTNFSLA